MTPQQRGRFCAACQKKVHDLSAMSASEAQAFLQTDEDICVSYLSDDSGDVKFRPTPVVPLHRLVRRASMASAAGLSLALAACAPHGDGPTLEVDQERPAFLEVTPSIPDAEPCESEPPPAVDEPEDLIRVKGDYAAPEPEPKIEKRPRVKGRLPIRRTAGRPSRKPLGNPDDPLSGL